MGDQGYVLVDPVGNLSFFRPEARTATELHYLGWNVPPDELQHIPEHWLTHAEPEQSMHYLLALIYSAFTIAALTGNGIVIWVFMSAKALRTPSNIFVVNLAILDFLMMSKAPIFIYNSLNFGFALGNAGCQVFATLGAYSGIGAGLTNAFIGYDRYNVITRPMEGKLSMTKALCMVAFVWIYATPWALMPLFHVWGRFVPGTALLVRSLVSILKGILQNVDYFVQSMQSTLQEITNHATNTFKSNQTATETIKVPNATFLLTVTKLGPLSSEVRYLGWNVRPEDLQYIPEHWLTQQEPEHYMHYLLALLYVVLMIGSLTGNGLVIFIFSSAKSLRTPSNLFVLNLAVFDLIMMLKAPIFIYNSLNHGFALGNTFCQIFASVGSYSGIGAGMTNAFIAYDRYNVITKPMSRSLTYTKALIFNILIWVYCTPWVVMPATRFWGRFVPEGYLTSCSFDYLTDNFDTRLFVGTIFFCSFCMPTAMIIYYYSQIVGHVFSHEKALREQAKKMNVESLRSNVDKSKDTAEIRIAKAAITICFLFFVSWTPYGVMSLIGAFGDKSLLTPGVTMIPACTCKMVACIDPYVYAISHPRYRLELQKRLPWLAINEKAPESASAASTGTTQENQTTAA